MILAVLQARVSSTRLPGKVLKPILGEPMIMRQIERVRRSRLIDKLVVATSTEQSDDALEQACASHGVDCFRGNLDDVLDRFYMAAAGINPDFVVRLTGDCPLADPEIIDSVITLCRDGGYDYVSSALEPTFPDGLDVEAFRFSALSTAWREATLPSQREHVTPFIYNNPQMFRIGSLKGQENLSHLRWTVDESADFDLITTIYQTLYPHNNAFTTRDILALLGREPELATMNTCHERNEGYQKSLKKDAIYQKSGGQD
jgi:spore coat polysaccharide biosynthesis protein SpsF